MSNSKKFLQNFSHKNSKSLRDSYNKGSANGGSFAILLVVFVIAFGLGFLSSGLLIKQNLASDVSLTANNVTPATIVNETKTAIVTNTAVNVVAVTADGQGLLGVANIEMVPGKGRVLISTNPFIEPDTQYSAETARNVAVNFTGKNLMNYDIILSFNLSLIDDGSSVEGGVVGGPSAGAAMTTAMVAAAQGKQVRSDVAITGTINADSSVGPVGGVLEKAEAAGKAGMKLFLVPVGQKTLTYYEKSIEEKHAGNFIVKTVRYVPKTMNLNNYTMEQWNMSSIEVFDISDIVEQAIE